MKNKIFVYKYLVTSKDAEGVNNLFCSVSVSRFTGHEVQECVKVNVAGAVGIHNSQDALEVNLTLFKQII